VTVRTDDRLAEQFEAQRARLEAVAHQLLGSRGEAEDAVQEAWLRLSRSDSAPVANLVGWLTTTVARLCLDVLRARAARREELLDARVPEPVAGQQDRSDPEHEALLADAVGPALLVVLAALAPTERVVFVLHDVFAVRFDEIAPVVGRSVDATRQVASRARRKVRGASHEVRGARPVATMFTGQYRGTHLGLVNGKAGGLRRGARRWEDHRLRPGRRRRAGSSAEHPQARRVART
jgi:RNA polymerase sigma factor (sigma-70 family)